MIPGFGGHLVPEDFLEGLLTDDDPATAAAPQRRRALAGWRARTLHLGPAAGVHAVFDAAAMPLIALLGFDCRSCVEVSDAGAWAVLGGTHASVLLLVTAWGTPLDRTWRDAVVLATRHRASWCLLFNGIHVRLLRPARLFSRRYAEFDLDAAADEERTSAALWRLLAADVLDAAPGAVRGLEATLARADGHAARVCRSLRHGVLEATEQVLRALTLRQGPMQVDAAFEQSLTIVYRLLFLLFAEARALMPSWHPVYRESYSVEMLRERSLALRSRGLWDALRALTRLAHAGCRAGTLRVTPFNGRLFSPVRTPLADRRGLDDEAARRAILAVSTRPAPDGEGRERVSYRDLGVEELGGVYERLLDYAPHVRHDRRGRAHDVSLRPGSGVRKATGTFYTPRSIAGYLLRDTLAPLVRGASPERILSLRVLDPAMGSGAFLVGACRYLADAYEAALLEAGRCHATDLGPGEHASIRRLVAERCLFGVDLNPTAVQLARLSLWLTTLSADRPLTFLDHHLRVGDSLAGTWLSLLGRAPIPRRGRGVLPLFEGVPVEDAMRQAMPVRIALAETPNDTAAQVQAKERALAELAAPSSSVARWTRAADAWCAAWFASPPLPASAYASLRDHIVTGRSDLPAATARALLERVDAASASRRLFHWELQFPEVFFDGNGQRRPDAGFDAVVGNPPWDMVRADGDGDRDRQRAETTATVRFARDSGVYEARSDGHANRYQLFAERAVALARPGGRVGLVLPSGLLTDHGSASLRRLLFARCDVDRLIGFDNRAGVFPIHRSVRFVLVSATTGRETHETLCRFGETDTTVLDEPAAADGRLAAEWFTVRVRPSLLARLSGEDLAIPDMRSAVDLAVVERAAALFPPLGARDGWQAHFGRELNATEDRGCLRTDGVGWPVLEGKLIDPFRPRRRDARWHVRPADALARLGHRVERARLAYRDVASAGNRLTLIAAVLPARTASTHTLFCLKSPLPLEAQHFLCAVLNSLVVNFLVRLRVSTHVTTAIVERLPVPREDQAGAAFADLTRGARRLAESADADVLARLNAIVAKLYQLSEPEFAHVLDTFPLVPVADRAAMMTAYRER
jgi:hypothetical protein